MVSDVVWTWDEVRLRILDNFRCCSESNSVENDFAIAMLKTISREQ